MLSIIQKIRRKFRSEFKWKDPFRFLLTGIFGITSGGGPLVSVGIFRPKFAVSFLTNRFFTLTREFGKGVKNGKTEPFLLPGWPESENVVPFSSGIPVISDRLVWHNGKHP